MILFHTGFSEIRWADVRLGRWNADFGQGFYLTPDEGFARRWARTRKGEDTIINTYELDLTGLKVLRLVRDEAWFDMIFGNRNMKPAETDADVITGPIANDTIYETYGIITSGFLKRETALDLLRIGPEYIQTVLRTEKAARQLKWLSSEILPAETIAEYRKTVEAEEAEYMRRIGERIRNSEL